MEPKKLFLKLYELRTAAVVAMAVAGWGGSAKAYTFNSPPDWEVQLDSSFAYTIGFRASHRNAMIANSPVQQNDEYKFPNFGNITTNRLNFASEFTAQYQRLFGVDVSADAWKDFAYTDQVETNPGFFAPGVPYSSLSSEPSGRYASYTNYWYNQGVELDNAFVESSFNVGDTPVSLKVGRLTEYWGTALFNGEQAISYGQSPLNILKAVDAPGTETKDLFMPRGQATLHVQIAPTLSLGFQYAFEYRENVLPEGGTYLGIADPLLIGPQSLGGIPRGHDFTPPDVDGNFGLEAIWTPNFLNGEVGLYFRQFDDVSPYTLYQLGNSPTLNYHLAFAKHIRLYGFSMDKDVGLVSVGLEGSIRQNTALFTVPGAGGNPAGDDGARGNISNVVLNGLYGLPQSSLWSTGSLIGEIAWTHLLGVTHQAGLYNGEGYACTGGMTNGCATVDEVNANINFDPQWLQVWPGVDIDMPINVAFGIHGNGQTAATSVIGNQAGTIAYGVGLHAYIRQLYNVTLNYVGYHAPFGTVANNGFGQSYYTGGSGQYMWNDKSQVLLTLSTNF
jgi:hypothetical protein